MAGFLTADEFLQKNAIGAYDHGLALWVVRTYKPPFTERMMEKAERIHVATCSSSRDLAEHVLAEGSWNDVYDTLIRTLEKMKVCESLFTRKLGDVLWEDYRRSHLVIRDDRFGAHHIFKKRSDNVA